MEDLHGLAISSFQPEIVASATRVKLAIGAAAPESMLISLLPPFDHAPTIPSLGCNRGASRISPDMQNFLEANCSRPHYFQASRSSRSPPQSSNDLPAQGFEVWDGHLGQLGQDREGLRRDL
jgi:hypothetical protein